VVVRVLGVSFALVDCCEEGSCLSWVKLGFWRRLVLLPIELLISAPMMVVEFFWLAVVLRNSDQSLANVSSSFSLCPECGK
jgi:hypothetical protein